MADSTWTWARLDDRAVELVSEAERTIGADVVLVYTEGGPRTDGRTRLGLSPAALDASQLECLQGMERMLGAVAVAYQRA